MVEPNSAETTSIATPKVLETSDAQLMSDGATHKPQITDEAKTKSKKNLIFVAVAVVLSFGGSLGAFFVGKSSVDLKKEQKISYDSGYDVGNTAGYSRGYSAGKTAGCEGIFSFSDGTYDYLTPYNPYNHYNRYPGSEYYAKSNC